MEARRSASRTGCSKATPTLSAGQWTNDVKTFAVNPVDPNGIMMGSAAGRLFLTRDEGLNWNAKAEPSTLDGTIATALAFGAPLPNSINLNDFLYVGTLAGNIWVSTTGGGNLANSWTNITAGSFGTLDGSAIQKIVPNPTRGSHELFAVTRNGIYHMADWTVPGAVWENITTDIRTITSQAFGHSDWVTPVLGFNLNPFITLAVDWRPTFSPQLSAPVLFVGGDGGVFRAVYNADATTWARFPSLDDGAASDGGGLPVVKVTDLDLALGNIDPNSGRPIPSGAPDMLLATTLGRGAWASHWEFPLAFPARA